ncbi:MAG: thiol-disulfide isomerase/thioredoxin [Myxococcota bacterium]|jgi:thiol-disulfide isomerase/thioredoxin
MRVALGLAIVALVAWALLTRVGWFGDPPNTLQLRDRVTSFRLPVVTDPGRTVSSNDLRGRGILLNFWASWCDPCVAELPLLTKLYERYHGLHFTVVGVTDERRGKMADFLSKNPLPYPTVYDRDSELRARFGADGLPFTVYVGPDGRVAGTSLGRLDELAAVKAVERLIILSREHQRAPRSPSELAPAKADASESTGP